jgi:hypothetical protein
VLSKKRDSLREALAWPCAPAATLASHSLTHPFSLSFLFFSSARLLANHRILKPQPVGKCRVAHLDFLRTHFSTRPSQTIFFRNHELRPLLRQRLYRLDILVSFILPFCSCSRHFKSLAAAFVEPPRSLCGLGLLCVIPLDPSTTTITTSKRR